MERRSENRAAGKGRGGAGGGQRPTILVLMRNRAAQRRWQCRGIRRYAEARGWRVAEACVAGGAAEARAALRKTRPCGVVFMLRRPVAPRVFGRVPVVYFDCPEEVAGTPYLTHDAEQTAHLAARELFAAHCAAYAFAAYLKPPYVAIPHWCAERERCFVAEVRRRKGTLAPPFHPASPGNAGRLRELRAWLRALPKPCGVFAANDRVAAEIRQAARREGIALPGDVAVVGVDDESRVCLHGRPTISSVIPDWEGGGFAAAAALGDLIDGRAVEGRTTFRPLGLARRETTARSPSPADARILEAVALIRARACSGLCLDDVVAMVRGSRRFVTKLFREVTGASILEEIRRVRFEMAKVLLSRPGERLAAVAARCGYESLPTFCREFKRVAGATPEAWRARRMAVDD